MEQTGPASISCVGVVPASAIVAEDEEETSLLVGMYERAKSYITKFQWCDSIKESYFGVGLGGVVAAFLFRISSSRPDVDEWLWVIVGDVPPAYLVTDEAKNPIDALHAYISEMSNWIKAVRNGQPTTGIIPVNVPTTPEWADRLDTRLKMLVEEIIPILANE